MHDNLDTEHPFFPNYEQANVQEAKVADVVVVVVVAFLLV
jgi:hypothetical protein